MRIKPMPRQEYIQSVLDYNSDTGEFKWKIRKQKTFCRNGKIAGTKGKKAIQLFISNKSYYAHRLAYVYVHGDILTTEMQVDHINNNSFDNRIENLRLATHAENCSNARKWNKKQLPKGVSKQTISNRYRARLQVGKNVVYLGTFDTPELAHAAYIQAAQKHHGEFARAI